MTSLLVILKVPNFCSRPKLSEMEPLADQGRALLASSSGGGAISTGSEPADFLSAVGIAAPLGVMSAAIPALVRPSPFLGVIGV